jgi:hypothetical protein
VTRGSDGEAFAQGERARQAPAVDPSAEPSELRRELDESAKGLADFDGDDPSEWSDVYADERRDWVGMRGWYY